jgi:hypothetical protein
VAQSKPQPTTRGGAIVLDNGISGDGQWQVSVGAGGDTTIGSLDGAGPIGLEDLIFQFLTYVDAGSDGGAVPLSLTTISSPPTSTGPQEVTSSGSFPGPNGDIEWTAVATVPEGEQSYEVRISFSSSSAFGDVRVINYFDQDVLGVADDILILLGTPGDTDFQMLTLDDTEDLGIGHAAGYDTAANASYVGFAADQYPELQSAIEGAGTSYAVAGNIDTGSLPPYSDPRYPDNDAYGPRDITGAYAFDLDPAADSAEIQVGLGGSVSGEVPGDDPDDPDPIEQIPVPTLALPALLLLGMLMLVIAWRAGRIS